MASGVASVKEHTEEDYLTAKTTAAQKSQQKLKKKKNVVKKA